MSGMFIFHKRYAFLANLPLRHHTCCLPCFPPIRVANPTLASCPDLPHLPVGPFLIFPVDRFHSVPASVLFLKPSAARTKSPYFQSS
ncbi:unnamed protein product [Protopolystoma xenopodis]|uniref:Uncharacterized protein n=1 Tax=Protopolystoma xenopodis TaxID=117903 RepID=A0A3S5A159_9PLAT|nr:unnamed protein product [Protopolystoma xenopodis]